MSEGTHSHFLALWRTTRRTAGGDLQFDILVIIDLLSSIHVPSSDCSTQRTRSVGFPIPQTSGAPTLWDAVASTAVIESTISLTFYKTACCDIACKRDLQRRFQEKNN